MKTCVNCRWQKFLTKRMYPCSECIGLKENAEYDFFCLPDGDIIIEYVTGEDDPQIEDVRTAIKLLIGGLHGNRQPFIEDGRNVLEMPFGVKALLDRGRVII